MKKLKSILSNIWRGKASRKTPTDRPQDLRQWPELTSEDESQMGKVTEDLIDSMKELSENEERRKTIEKRLF